MPWFYGRWAPLHRIPSALNRNVNKLGPGQVEMEPVAIRVEEAGNMRDTRIFAGYCKSAERASERLNRARPGQQCGISHPLFLFT
jgi:hypothetical protein